MKHDKIKKYKKEQYSKRKDNTVLVDIDQSDFNNLHYALMNALGEGQINVCGEGGDLDVGDLITTSSMPGKGMKQDGDIIRNYTVAKCRENVTFKNKKQVKMVACIYLCG